MDHRLGALAAVSIVLIFVLPTGALPSVLAQAPAPVKDPSPSGVAGFVLSDVGAPLGGALIVATANGSSVQATSDSDGSYALSTGATGVWSVNVSAAGHATQQKSVVVAPLASPGQNFTLKHTGSVIQGSVLDGKTGAGIGNVTVKVSAQYGYPCKYDAPCPMMADSTAGAPNSMPIRYVPPSSTRTASDGHYIIAVDPGNVTVDASKDGYQESNQGLDANHDARLDLKLMQIPPKSAVLQGQVLDAKTGKPLPDAYVNAWPDQPQAMDVQAGGAATATSGSASSSDASTPSANATSAGSSGATSGGGSAPSSSGVAYPVRCCCCGPYEGNSTQAGAQGRFRMAMYPGSYVLSASAPDHGQRQVQVTLAEGQTLTQDLQLPPIPSDTVSLHGQALDAQTGKPVPGAWVSSENAEWGAYNSTQTKADGTFELHTKPGFVLVWIRADKQGYPYAVPVEAPSCPPDADCRATIAKGEPNPSAPPQPDRAYYPWVLGASYRDGQDAALQAKLLPKAGPTVTLKGYVLNATAAKGIPGASVNVHNEDTGDWGYATTDKDGSWSMEARPGVHTIEANAQGYFHNAAVVSVGDQGLRVDLKLQPGAATNSCCIAYGEARGLAATPPAGTTGPAPTGAPAPSRDATAPSGGNAGAPVQSVASAGGNSPATYKSSAGSLGPYDASAAPPDNGNGTAVGPGSGSRAKAPGFEALAALGAVALAGFAVSRRRP